MSVLDSCVHELEDGVGHDGLWGTERDGCRHADLGVWETLMFLLEAVVVAVHRPRGMHDFPTRARVEIPAKKSALQESLGNPPLFPCLQDSQGNG